MDRVPTQPRATAAGNRLRADGKFFSRGGVSRRVCGVTYGPFAPNRNGEPFPAPSRVVADFALMTAAGLNAIRTYHLPPRWLLDSAGGAGIDVFIDCPWRKHLCFLDSASARREAFKSVESAAMLGRDHAAVMAYSIGNEIPPTVVRWHGATKIERFLANLADAAKQVDPGGLVTYANYPPTEYIDLSFLDFVTFNVYLHDINAFRRYLIRLQHLVGDQPLLLGELGMDTLRHSEEEQATFLAGHVREATLTGLAGSFVFSFTDDWHTGGHRIEDWAFGITTADRTPKPAYRALKGICRATPTALLPATPRVSVVVCSYNGGRTLEECLRSLLALDYPDYEIIVVDDGSTDHTAAILARTPGIRSIRQDNLGLSVARNTGFQASTGAIVAYTDSDCFADPYWLTHLIDRFQRTTAAAVGGPNLTPNDGWHAACVAAAPGQPTHVLLTDKIAEHIPGCNMAFRREALEAIKGFDPLYRTAGDDVDVCWRLQHEGFWITFAPGAFVWHHRRQSPRSYLKQQAGYGIAEALLWFKHPDRFTARGHGKWQGSLYGDAHRGLTLTQPIIYRGTFAAGLFQCIYKPGPAHWAMLPSTLEWHLAMLVVALAAVSWPYVELGTVAMLLLSAGVAAIQAMQAKLPPEHDGFRSRLLVGGLCYAQPLVRTFWRYRTRLFAYRAAAATGEQPVLPPKIRLPLLGTRTIAYWSETGVGRLPLLDRATAAMTASRWGLTLDSGWGEWDIQVHCHPWTVVQVCTAQEDHGGPRYLLRVRYRVRPSGYLNLLAAASTIAVGATAALGWVPVVSLGAACATAWLAFWITGIRLAAQVSAVIDERASSLGLVRCPPKKRKSWLRKLLPTFRAPALREDTSEMAALPTPTGVRL